MGQLLAAWGYFVGLQVTLHPWLLPLNTWHNSVILCVCVCVCVSVCVWLRGHSLLKTCILRADEMAQRVETLAAKPDGLSSNPRAHMVLVEKVLSTSRSLSSTWEREREHVCLCACAEREREKVEWFWPLTFLLISIYFVLWVWLVQCKQIFTGVKLYLISFLCEYLSSPHPSRACLPSTE